MENPRDIKIKIPTEVMYEDMLEMAKVEDMTFNEYVVNLHCIYITHYFMTGESLNSESDFKFTKGGRLTKKSKEAHEREWGMMHD